MRRYAANKGIINDEAYAKIHMAHIVIIGAGGIGGYLAESFARLGVKKLTLIDPDYFEATNLNRQRFARENTIGEKKVSVAKDALAKINSTVTVDAIDTTIERCSHEVIFTDVTLVVDAVDTIATKIYIEALAKRYGIPLLHGALGGWYGQFSLIKDNYTLLKSYYKDTDYGVEKTLKCPTFMPVIIAGLMFSEWIKYMVDTQNLTTNKLYFYDARLQSIESIFTK